MERDDEIAEKQRKTYASWSDYMRDQGREEYGAWELAVKPYTDEIAALKAEVAELRNDDLADVWQSTLEDIIELTGADGPSSIAALAVDGVKRVKDEIAALREQVRVLREALLEVREWAGEYDFMNAGMYVRMTAALAATAPKEEK